MIGPPPAVAPNDEVALTLQFATIGTPVGTIGGVRRAGTLKVMWRWGLIVVLLFTAGFFETLQEHVPFADAIGLAVAFGVPACLLVDAKIRQRRGAAQ